jgi:deoxycytidine triphosphate deaminase
MMLISDSEIEKLLIRGVQEAQDAKGWWERGEWGKIEGKILIDPFSDSCLNALSYELSVGEEWISLRDPYKVRRLGTGEVITIAPHETILIISEEYIALPRTIAGLVVPRARKLFEGSTLAATRVDPTWYGKLKVGFTNLSQFTTSLGRGERFCNIVFVRTGEVKRALSLAGTPHLGRTTIGKPEYPSLRPEELKTPEQVTAKDVRQMVESFGAPFDIVRGALKETKDEMIREVEKDLGPRMVETAVTQAVQRAFKWQQRMFGILLALFGILVAGLLTFLFRSH